MDPLPNEVTVDVRRLTRRFGTVAAVDDVSFAVRPGEILGLLDQLRLQHPRARRPALRSDRFAPLPGGRRPGKRRPRHGAWGTFLKGVGLGALWPHFAGLACIAMLLLSAAVLRFRKSLD